MPSRQLAVGRALLIAVSAGLALEVVGFPAIFEDQTAEFLDRCNPVEGFPEELRGSLYFAGPSLWSLGGQELTHSFDGLGRLHRLYYDGERRALCHSARFIASEGNRKVLRKCDLTSAGGFSPPTSAAWWGQLPLAALMAANLDNAWVNQLHFAGRLELMTDTPDVVLADVRTLEATGNVRWNDSIPQTWMPVVLSTAHPIIHPDSGEAWNILLDPGVLSNDLVLFKRSPAAPERREQVVRIPVGRSMLVQHSWALSVDFAVLFAHPMFMDLPKAMTTRGMVGAFVEQPSRQNQTRLLLVPLGGGSARELRAPPFVLVHAVNAYREADCLVVDVEGRPAEAESESFYGAFMLDRIRRLEASREYFEEHFKQRRYGLYRFEIALEGTEVQEPRHLWPGTLVFPTISPRVRGRRHCFVWAAEGETLIEDAMTLRKLSLCEGVGSKQLHLPGFRMVAEASFVPAATSAANEDAGWLLAPVHEVNSSRSALAVVDAASMQLAVLAWLRDDDVLNWCAHSTYVEEAAEAATQGGEMLLGDVKEALERCGHKGRGADL